MSPQTEPIFLIVDLFCGAGGTTTGFEQAILDGNSVAKVIACVNHDPKAIKSHWQNHPDVKHFEEDIRTLDLTGLISIVNWWKERYPDAYLILWASLECTNFSKAKGGLPRDADSRTLADHLHRYVEALNPEYIQIENVVEFMSWGPLDANGKPVSKKNGQDFERWKGEMDAHGYYNDWKELNSANFGAFTSRNRLFGCFAKPGLPIAWPEPTHAKKPGINGMFGNDLKKWKAVKEVLDFTDEGESIFARTKELSDKTLERIYAGLVKYVAKGDNSFISKYFSGRPANKNISVEGPAGTIKTVDGQALVNAEFLLQTYAANSKGHNTFPVDGVARTITTRDATALIQPEFIVTSNGGVPTAKVYDVNNPSRVITTKDNQSIVFLQHYYSQGGQLSSVNDPAPVIPTKARTAMVQPEFFLDKHFGAAQNQSVDQPAGTIMPNDKHRLVEVEPFLMPTNFNNGPKSIDDSCPTITADRHYHYIVNPSWGGNPSSIEEPCVVVVARQDKAPLYFVQVEGGNLLVPIYNTDSEIMIKIKHFMLVYRLKDIKMRMLRVLELLRIQGFPMGYKLFGNQADQKRFIGNSVVPDVVRAWCLAMAMNIKLKLKKNVA
ncbi:MAG: DNA cytosine methyltransferase [Bacteroidota bacterium]